MKRAGNGQTITAEPTELRLVGIFLSALVTLDHRRNDL